MASLLATILVAAAAVGRGLQLEGIAAAVAAADRPVQPLANSEASSAEADIFGRIGDVVARQARAMDTEVNASRLLQQLEDRWQDQFARWRSARRGLADARTRLVDMLNAQAKLNVQKVFSDDMELLLLGYPEPSWLQLGSTRATARSSNASQAAQLPVPSVLNSTFWSARNQWLLDASAGSAANAKSDADGDGDDDDREDDEGRRRFPGMPSAAARSGPLGAAPSAATKPSNASWSPVNATSPLPAIAAGLAKTNWNRLVTSVVTNAVPQLDLRTSVQAGVDVYQGSLSTGSAITGVEIDKQRKAFNAAALQVDGCLSNVLGAAADLDTSLLKALEDTLATIGEAGNAMVELDLAANAGKEGYETPLQYLVGNGSLRPSIAFAAWLLVAWAWAR